MRRIEAHAAEAQKPRQAALEVGPSGPQVITRAKGKEVTLTDVEREEQYQKLKEKEIHCQLIQRKIQEQGRILEQMRAQHGAPEEAAHQR